ncbi:hypothetical protein CC77DRAFT_951449, partial [Alternaria alternata]
RSKALRYSKHSKLASLLILEDIFKEVLLNFVTRLLLAKDNLGCVFNIVLVIVNRFLKIAIYIPALKI